MEAEHSELLHIKDMMVVIILTQVVVEKTYLVVEELGLLVAVMVGSKKLAVLAV
tara:strand:- start:184 stop:345 length:162 start_codon:yes stop_codon:yes gene_type:complete